MISVPAVIDLQVPDDGFDGRVAFEEPAFFVIQALVLASVLDADTGVC